MNFVTLAEKIRTVAGLGPLQLHALLGVININGQMVNVNVTRYS